MTQSVTVTAPPTSIDPDEVTLEINEVEWSGWTDIRITRGLERMPSDFELTVTELHPGQADKMPAKPGHECLVWIGRDKAVTGYVDRVVPSFSAGSHSVTIVGRGKCADLVDCSASWETGQIQAASVLEVARRLAKPFGIDVTGLEGRPVGRPELDTLVPYLMLQLGQTPWDVISMLCAVNGLLAYELADGRLMIAAEPNANNAGKLTRCASGFEQGVNILAASATWAMDQRYSEVRAYKFATDLFPDVSGAEANYIGKGIDEGVPRFRPLVILAETGKAYGIETAARRAQWEARRRWGLGHQVSITTDSWRDSAGKLYAPNSLTTLHAPDLRIDGKAQQIQWVIGDVTYRKSLAGTACDLLLRPLEAYAVAPTLPPYQMPVDIAQLPTGLAR